MQDIIVTVVAFVSAAIMLRGYLRRRAAAAPPKCANCVVVELAQNSPEDRRAKV